MFEPYRAVNELDPACWPVDVLPFAPARRAVAAPDAAKFVDQGKEGLGLLARNVVIKGDDGGGRRGHRS
jgi:hypothetical protein